MTATVADAGPLWLRIVIAAGPPVLAAIIAGFFALSNTTSRRAERLKTLNEVRVSARVESINPEYAIEKLMLHELKAMEIATATNLRWRRRFGLSIYFTAGCLYAFYSIELLKLMKFTRHPNQIAGILTTLVLMAILVDQVVVRRRFCQDKAEATRGKSSRGKELEAVYDRALKGLDRTTKPASTEVKPAIGDD